MVLPGTLEIGDGSITQTWLWVIPAAAILGMFLSPLPSRKGPILALALGVLGSLLVPVVLLLLGPAFSDRATPHSGFWLTEGLFLTAAWWGVYRLFSLRRTRRGEEASPEAQSPSGEPPPRGSAD